MTVFAPLSPFPLAVPRLSRAELASKVGPQPRYPRPGGVLVPAPLGEFLGAAFTATLPARVGVAGDVRRRLGRAVVAAVTRLLRQLPAPLLRAEVPHPSLALGALIIEDRTRNMLERLLPVLGRVRRWTVQNYLEIPGFGARCLVDLLAAVEESSAPSAVAAAATPAAGLDDITRLLLARLPIDAGALGPLLVEHGLLAAPLATSDLIDLYRRAGAPVPFRIVASGQMAIAVPAGNRGVMASVASAAVRLASFWGVISVQLLTDRVAAQTASPITPAMAKRLLVALPRLRWLDTQQEWFAFTDDASGLGDAVRKVFAVTDRVDHDVLLAALAKASPRQALVPPSVLERYLVIIADCQVDRGRVRCCTGGPRRSVDGPEAALVSLLEDRHRRADRTALGIAAAAQGLSPSTVRRLLKTSPLFVEGPENQVALVGHGRIRSVV